MVGFRWEREIELAVTAAMLSTRDGGLVMTQTNTTALTVGKCIKLKGKLSGPDIHVSLTLKYTVNWFYSSDHFLY